MVPKKDPASSSMAIFQPENAPFSRAARPAFALSGTSQAPSTFLFVNAGSTKTREERRQIRAQVMFATHEARRRRGMQGRKVAKEEDHKEIIPAASPLLDPFDSLPVKAFPGMNEILKIYIDAYAGLPLLDDPLIKHQGKGKYIIIRSNTLWDAMSCGETSLLVMLAETVLLFDTTSPDSKWRILHFRLKERALQSIREGMSSLASRDPLEMPDSFVVAVAAMEGASIMFGDEKAAIVHLAATRELVRLRGGIDTFQPVARRIIVWCDLHCCAAHQLSPVLAPIPPASSGADDDDPHSSLPRAFRSAVAAAHSRTLAHLPKHWQCTAFPPNRIFHALHLTSIAASPTWESAHFGPSVAARIAVASVQDDALFLLLGELVKLTSPSSTTTTTTHFPSSPSTHPPFSAFSSSSSTFHHNDADNTNDTNDANDDSAGRRAAANRHYDRDHPHYQPIDQAMLHAANAYLWTMCSYLPAGAPMNVAFLERLRASLAPLLPAMKDRHSGASSSSSPSSSSSEGNQALAPALLWASVVGWVLAKKVCSHTARGGTGTPSPASEQKTETIHVEEFGATGRRIALLKWFEDRVGELLALRCWVEEEGVIGGAGGGGGEESGGGGTADERRRAAASAVMADFPGSEEFSRGWRCLLMHHRYCCNRDNKRWGVGVGGGGAPGGCIERRGSGLVHTSQNYPRRQLSGLRP